MNITTNTEYHFSAEEIKQKTSKPLLWIAIGSIVMLFAAFTSAAIVSKAASKVWVTFTMPSMFYVSTIVIVISSFTFYLAGNSAKKNETGKTTLWVLFTLLLGILFTIFQVMAWNDLVNQGVFFAGKQSVAGSSYMYVLSGMHLLHLLGGLIAMAVVLSKSAAKKYTSENNLGIQLAGIYWHFLGGLWVYLFLFLFFIS
ncbi:MAG: cytochrome c oxidase subunit 3 [Flavobacteriales bacterium]|nr:cytochrome c oxidase subunit 3 [Flavobacteriales bacterium]